MQNSSFQLSEKQLGFLERAIELSRQAIRDGHGGPFGCVIVKDDNIIGEGCNRVTSSNDPTAHAEVVAIREACSFLGHYQLDECELYTSCEPCPMCLGAIYWARPRMVIYANTKQDAAAISFDDAFIYDEISAGMTDRKIPFIHRAHEKALQVFKEWKEMPGKKVY
jgi:tRNA(Arg) A34 adenosine deaminase TadA